MKQDTINFDITTIEDNRLNTEDILKRYKEISNSIANAASAISPVFSEQLNEFISKINASEYFKNYEEALKPLTESLIKSFAYSEQMSNTLSQFAKYYEQSKPQYIELFSCLVERVSKLQNIIDSKTVSSNKQISDDADNLANQIVDDLNAMIIADSNGQISLPVEKKDKWTREQLIQLSQLIISLIALIISICSFLQSNNESNITNIYNTENINININIDCDDLSNGSTNDQTNSHSDKTHASDENAIFNTTNR